MTRRHFNSLAAAAIFNGAPPPSKMGIATTSYLGFARPRDPVAFLDHCHALGAAGIQAAITGDPAKLRAHAEQLGMYVEGMVALPKGSDTAAFEKALKDASEAGASCVRTGALSGRRYEVFSSLDEWRAFVAKAKESIKAAVPVADRLRLPLALENHKDWTLDEMLPLLKTYESEYFGCLLDFGNNIALLDDPARVVDSLAPYAVSTHVKDIAVEEWKDGFLMSEVRLGEGFFDLPHMVGVVRRARPKTKFNLEMITRDPLQIPCLTEKYWATFPDRSGLLLARAMKLVEKQGNRLQTLPRVTGMDRAAQLRLEDENVKSCLHYGREKLAL